MLQPTKGVFVWDYFGKKSLFFTKKKKISFRMFGQFFKNNQILKKNLFSAFLYKLKKVVSEKNQFSAFLTIYKI